MKNKIIMVVILVFVCFLTGCQLNNNPTSKAEELLGKYQMIDKEISTSYLNLVSDNSLSSDYQKKYENLIKKQYQNLSYDIKEEKIDGDTATVTAQIEVLDYKTVFQKYNYSNTITADTHEKILDELANVKEKTTYTIDFTVTKDEKGNWNLDDLNEEQKKKLLGMY